MQGAGPLTLSRRSPHVPGPLASFPPVAGKCQYLVVRAAPGAEDDPVGPARPPLTTSPPAHALSQTCSPREWGTIPSPPLKVALEVGTEVDHLSFPASGSYTHISPATICWSPSSFIRSALAPSSACGGMA